MIVFAPGLLVSILKSSFEFQKIINQSIKYFAENVLQNMICTLKYKSAQL